MKKIKIISLMLIAITLISVISPILQTVQAQSYAIDYQGSVTYGESKVGKFFIEGQRAFCIDHKKTTPNTGTIVSQELYDDENVLKCLYYGLGGAEPWCFESEEQAIVYTTLALDHFVNGNRNIIAQEFINYVKMKDTPQFIVEFSQDTLNAYLTEDNTKQRTQTISVTGDSKYYLTIPLPKGVILVNETKGWIGEGDVDVYGGDNFHLEAPLNINGSWSTNEIRNNRYTYQPIIYKTSNETYQRLASGYKPVHAGRVAIDLTVNWVSTGTFEIYKKDEETRTAISNTKFEVRDEKGIVIDTITTNAQGYAKSGNLLAGKYTLKEIATNDKYILDSTPIEITITPGEKKTIDITNKHKKGNIKIIKVDSRDNKTPIPNVTFEIWKVDTNEKVATKTTGIDGTITINDLKIGKYKVKEVSTNEWYELNEKTNEVEIQWNKTSELTVGNNIKKGYIEIIKQDANYPDIKLENVKFEIKNSKGIVVDTLVTNKNGYAKSKPLPLDEKYEVKETQTIHNYVLSTDIENVEFTPNNKNKQLTFSNKHKQGNLKIIKIDSDNNKKAISGVEFELFSEEFQKVIGKYTTNSDGEIFIKNLRTGNYKLKEISTNEWYELNEETNEVEIQWNKTSELTVKNNIKKGYIEIIKQDVDYPDIKLKNVKFEIKNSKGILVDTLVTDKNGYAKSKPLRIDEKYEVKETQTIHNYVLSTDIENVEFTPNNKNKQLTFSNKHKQGNVKVIKIDSDNNKIAIGGVEFELFSEEFQKVIGKYTTNSDGEIFIKNLRTGNYKLKEISTNKWYNLAEDTQIVIEENKTSEAIVKNKLKKARVKVIKVDKDDNEIKIANVVFEVQDENGNVLEEITTNEKGEALTREYPIRDYEKLKLHEIKTDEFYDLNDKIIEVELQANKVTEVTIENEKIQGQIKIIKTSSEDNLINGEKAGTPIPNVKFEVYNFNGELVDTIITDEQGIAITKKLYKGEYIIKEVETLEEYILNDKEIPIEISKHNSIVEVEITNEPKKPEEKKLPRTGF